MNTNHARKSHLILGVLLFIVTISACSPNQPNDDSMLDGSVEPSTTEALTSPATDISASATISPVYTQTPTNTPTLVPTNTPLIIEIEIPTPTPSSTPKPKPTSTPIQMPSLTWIPIPAGDFMMGSSEEDLQQILVECNETEGKKTGRPCETGWFNEPQEMVTVASFEITKYEITNAQYRACIAAGVCDEPGRIITDNNIPYDPGYFSEAFPVVGVDWYDADTFCRWAGGRLPTELEWEKAARGTDGRRYPWGNTFESLNANLDIQFPSPVGSFPSGSSPYGVMDMAGNVFEWTSTQIGNNYVLRGGS